MASGTAAINVNPDATSLAQGCLTLIVHFDLALASGGQQVFLTQVAAAEMVIGVAVWQ